MEDLDIQAILQDAMSEPLAAIGDAAEALAERMQEVADQISESMAQAAAAMGDLQGAIDENTAATDENTTAAEDNAGAHDAMGQGAGGAASHLQLMALAAGAAATALVVVGAQGTDALTRVQALTGASSQQMQQYSAAIDEMTGTMGKSVSDLAGGLYDVVSVGFQGADALTTLKVAAEAAAAGGTDLHTVTSGLTGIMKAFGVQGKDAASVMDILLLGVRDGKASFQDFSNAIGLVAANAHGAGFSLQEATAALSTLTAVFPNARRAGMDLQHLMTAIGVNAEATGKAAEKMGLKFNQSAFDSMGLQQKLEYLQQITGGNEAEMLKLTGGTAGFAAAQVLLANGSKDFTRNLEDMKNAAGSTQNAFDEWHHSVGAAAEDMSGSFSDFAKNVVVAIGPGLIAMLHVFAEGFAAAARLVRDHADIAIPVIAALAAIIGTVLVAALYAMIAPLFAAEGILMTVVAPIAAVIAAIALLAIGFKLAYDHIKPFHEAVNAAITTVRAFAQELEVRLGPAMKNVVAAIQAGLAFIEGVWKIVWPGMQQVLEGFWLIVQGVVQVAWSIISGIFKIALDLLGGNWKQAWNDLLQMLSGVWAGIQHIVEGIADGILGTIRAWGALLLAFWGTVWDAVKTAVGNVFSAIGDFISSKVTAIRNTITGWLNDIKGAIQAGFQWVRDTIQAAINFVVGLFDWLYNHNYYFKELVDAIREDITLARDVLMAIWTAIKDFLIAAWTFIKTTAENDWLAVQRYIIQPVQAAWAFVTSKLGELKNWLVGIWNGIVADVRTAWNNFISAITGIGGRVTSSVHDSVVTPIQSAISGIISAATQWGTNLIQNFINGIKNMAGKVKDAIGNIAGDIGKLLGFHSPTEEGPGAEADEWMPALGRMLVSGLHDQQGPIRAAAQALAAQMAGALGNVGGTGAGGNTLTPTLAAAAAGGSSGAPTNVTMQVQMPDSFLAGTKLLDPTTRQQLAYELAAEMARILGLQGRIPVSYTGSR